VLTERNFVCSGLRTGGFFLPNRSAGDQTFPMPPSKTQKHTPTLDFLPDENPLSFDQYRRLSPQERRRQDDLDWQCLSDPQYRQFLARIFKMSLRPKKQSATVAIAAKTKGK
jgi:hypothetical protein